VNDGFVQISTGEPTLLQRAAWQRLWDILLAPVESQSASTVNECAAKPEPATPHRRQPKRLGADEPSRPRKQQRLGSHPEPSDGPQERTKRFECTREL
jgi:hypothetical protein